MKRRTLQRVDVQVIILLTLAMIGSVSSYYCDSLFIHPIVMMILIYLLMSTIAYCIFRRVSNPNFKDVYNTDSLTQVKNRNAFDADIYNLMGKQKFDELYLIIADLNSLKKVNDNYGHKVGDSYIIACAQALSVEMVEDYVVYRIGGDEFATLLEAEEGSVKKYIEAVKEKLSVEYKEKIPFASVSMGYAKCRNGGIDKWEQSRQEADQAMYSDKKRFYETYKEFDERT